MAEPAKILARKAVMIADDEKFSRSIVLRLLRDLGCENSAQAKDGADALVQMSQMDFNMPGMNGLQMLRMIRMGEGGVPHDMPVIMLTGHADSGLVGGAMALDVDAFIIKPVSIAVLQSRVAKVLSESRDIKAPAYYAKVDIEAICEALLNPPAAQAKPKPDEKEEAKQPAGVRVKLEEVTEGAILADDIRAPTGELLLAAGVALSPRFLRRLKELGGILNLEYLMLQP
jgi:CheY-like chemotaxis protein